MHQNYGTNQEFRHSAFLNKELFFPFSPFPMGLCSNSKKKVEGVTQFALLFGFQLKKSDDSCSFPNAE